LGHVLEDIVFDFDTRMLAHACRGFKANLQLGGAGATSNVDVCLKKTLRLGKSCLGINAVTCDTLIVYK